MHAYLDLFSTGNWYQDVLMYSLIGLLVLANMQLIRHKDGRRRMKRA